MAFSHLLIVIIAAIWITIIAERRGIQAPLLIALLGLGASFLPDLPELELEPHIILSIVLPPLLYSAAIEFSFISFMRRLREIANLGIVLVGVTTVAVGVIAALVVPELTLPAALVLAAIVSPPDAVAAVAIGRELHLPKRLMTVLKGESLINDAAALTLFSFTAAAVTGTHLFIGNAALYFLYSAVVGVLVGLAIGVVVQWIKLRLANATMATVAGIIVPFAAYLVAEELHASGVIAVVAAGFSLGHNAAEANYQTRIQEREVWKTVSALLEAFTFAYIGLQLRFVIEDAREAGYDPLRLFGAAGLILLAVILVRIAWVQFSAWSAARRRRARQSMQWRRRPSRLLPKPLTWKENLIVSWAGMRGVVTLAAAAGVPLATVSGAPFPGRAAIQAIAFVVTIGTLLIQGATLPWLIRRLDISDPEEVEEERAQFRKAQVLVREAAAATANSFVQSHPSADARRIAQSMLERAAAIQALPDGGEDAKAMRLATSQATLELRRAILEAQRAALIKARDDGGLDDEIMRTLLEQLDLEQAVMAGWTPDRVGQTSLEEERDEAAQ